MGTIAAVHWTDTKAFYDFVFDDGDEEKHVPRHFIRPLAQR